MRFVTKVPSRIFSTMISGRRATPLQNRDRAWTTNPQIGSAMHPPESKRPSSTASIGQPCRPHWRTTCAPPKKPSPNTSGGPTDVIGALASQFQPMPAQDPSDRLPRATGPRRRPSRPSPAAARPQRWQQCAPQPPWPRSRDLGRARRRGELDVRHERRDQSIQR